MSTVVLLHGLGQSSVEVQNVFGPVVPAGMRVIAPDVRAHGADDRVGAPADFTLPALARDLATRLGAEPPGRLTVIGVSMGAALALRLALDSALPIERLVFVRPAFTADPLPHNLRAFPVIGELLADHGPVEGERHFLGSAVYAETLAESRLGADGLLAQFRSPGAARRAIRLLEIPRSPVFADSPAEAEALDSLAAPTAIVWAPRDPVHPVSVAEEWMARLPDAANLPLPARDDGYATYLAATRAAVARALDWA